MENVDNVDIKYMEDSDIVHKDRLINNRIKLEILELIDETTCTFDTK